jgi:hypothetical protein
VRSSFSSVDRFGWDVGRNPFAINLPADGVAVLTLVTVQDFGGKQPIEQTIGGSTIGGQLVCLWPHERPLSAHPCHWCTRACSTESAPFQILAGSKGNRLSGVDNGPSPLGLPLRTRPPHPTNCGRPISLI